MPRTPQEISTQTASLYRELCAAKFTVTELTKLGEAIYAELDLAWGLQHEKIPPSVVAKLYRTVARFLDDLDEAPKPAEIPSAPTAETKAIAPAEIPSAPTPDPKAAKPVEISNATSGTKAPEPKAPEPKAPEPKASGTKTTSETRASETRASETRASETKASETKASETKASGTKASETKASETKAPPSKAPNNDTHDQPPKTLLKSPNGEAHASPTPETTEPTAEKW